MADFKTSYKLTGGNEGGYANDPHDRGGETYAGIARNFWPNWKGWAYVDAAKKQYGSNIHAINASLKANPVVQDLVSGFYMANFWNVDQLSHINDQRVADTLYDCSVNQGTGEAAHILQDACNVLSIPKIKSDGAIGPATLVMANSLDAELLYGEINEFRKASYKKDKGFDRYGAVWLSRLTKY